jgi:uncharacterized repeat protein (TIGR01451 family)
MINKTDNIKRIFVVDMAFLVGLVVGAIAVMSYIFPTEVFAEECTSDGAYGQTCIYNKTFELTKKVRIEGDNSWKDKVTDVKEDEVVEFKIKIKNIGEVETDDMKMTDYLPDELERVGGSGLTEEWDNFEPDETKTFKIKAMIDEDEFDRDDNFEKCVVNKAKVEYDGTNEGADTATVCYGNSEITELPDTGVTGVLGVLGLITTGLGIAFKKRS